MSDSLNRLAKWRSYFAGWQLGTRSIDDPECQAVRDHREATLLLRAEASALTGLLIQKGVFTVEEFTDCLDAEADMLNQDLSARFPGVTSSEAGLTYDLAKIRTSGLMKGWRL